VLHAVIVFKFDEISAQVWSESCNFGHVWNKLIIA